MKKIVALMAVVGLCMSIIGCSEMPSKTDKPKTTTEEKKTVDSSGPGGGSKTVEEVKRTEETTPDGDSKSTIEVKKTEKTKTEETTPGEKVEET